MVTKKKRSLRSLAASRPPLARLTRSMSRKASRTLINKHHQLEKARAKAIKNKDKEMETRLATELANLGGLDQYQKASLQGQSLDRGGDTSKVLIEWLPVAELKAQGQNLRMLEVGALSTRNACSTSGIFEVLHIDLNSQESGIQQQDFMDRPIPRHDEDRFDIISLSLVLNFVPDAPGRGRMLKRTLSFLKGGSDGNLGGRHLFPCLFIVLPRSCVDNSRYFTDARFDDLMATLGYTRLKSKKTQKLAYSLWKWSTEARLVMPNFSKQELNPGRARNNFVITLTGQP